MAMYEQVERGEATCKVAVVHVHCARDLHHKNVQRLSAFRLYDVDHWVTLILGLVASVKETSLLKRRQSLQPTTAVILQL